jgi:hypothetical protein
MEVSTRWRRTGSKELKELKGLKGLKGLKEVEVLVARPSGPSGTPRTLAVVPGRRESSGPRKDAQSDGESVETGKWRRP